MIQDDLDESSEILVKGSSEWKRYLETKEHRCDDADRLYNPATIGVTQRRHVSRTIQRRISVSMRTVLLDHLGVRTDPPGLS